MIHRFDNLRRRARRDPTISHQARLFEDICELAARDGYCCAGDRHFAELYGVERRTIRRWIAKLKTARYLLVEGATRARRLIPNEPAPGVSTVPDGATELRTPVVLSATELRTPVGRDLGHLRAGTKSIYISPGEREARAHEGGPGDVHQHPAVRAYREITGADLMADQFAGKIADVVGSEEGALSAWRDLVLVWLDSPRWNHRHVPRMLEAFAERRPEAARGPARREDSDDAVAARAAAAQYRLAQVEAVA